MITETHTVLVCGTFPITFFESFLFFLLFLIFSFGFYLSYTQCNVYERRTCASASVRVHRWFVHTAYTIYGCGLSECHTDFDVSSASQCLHFSCTIKSSSRTSTEFSSKIPVVLNVYIPKVFHFFVFGYHLSIRAGHSAKSSLPPSCYHHFVNVHPNRASYQPELKPKTWRFGKTKTFAAFDKYIYIYITLFRPTVCILDDLCVCGQFSGLIDCIPLQMQAKQFGKRL